VGCIVHVHGSNARNLSYSYLYLKLAKMLLFLLSLMFSFNKIREQEGRTGSAQKYGGKGKGGPNNVYTYE
jgi:hypothetical protein